VRRSPVSRKRMAAMAAAPGANEVADTSGSLPPLARSTIVLARGCAPAGQDCQAEDADAPRDALVLVHLENPGSGEFSQGKRQCHLWEFVWGTSLLTASVLATLDLTGLNVLEIGGGSGLCSLACAARANAAHVTMTDTVEDALKICEHSAQANGIEVPGRMSFAKLDWDKEEQIPEGTMDVVLGSDVLFFRGAAAPVARAFYRALRPGGIGILTDPFRLATEDFESKLDDLGVRVTTVVFTPEMLKEAQNLAQKAFVDVKRVKLLYFQKPVADGSPPRSSGLDKLQQVLEGGLPRFLRAATIDDY